MDPDQTAPCFVEKCSLKCISIYEADVKNRRHVPDKKQNYGCIGGLRVNVRFNCGHRVIF